VYIRRFLILATFGTFKKTTGEEMFPLNTPLIQYWLHLCTTGGAFKPLFSMCVLSQSLDEAISPLSLSSQVALQGLSAPSLLVPREDCAVGLITHELRSIYCDVTTHLLAGRRCADTSFNRDNKQTICCMNRVTQ
jgi:hypothetical protein